MQWIRSTFAALSTALIGSTMLAATAFAWSSDLQGRPDDLFAGSDKGYYVWHDDSGLHLRTTDPAGHHKYTFRIRTDGVFQNVDPVRLDGRDRVEILDNGRLMIGDFVTREGIDGVNFNIAGGNRMHLALHLDGDLAPTNKIYLGQDSSSPPSNPFVELR